MMMMMMIWWWWWWLWWWWRWWWWWWWWWWYWSLLTQGHLSSAKAENSPSMKMFGRNLRFFVERKYFSTSDFSSQIFEIWICDLWFEFCFHLFSSTSRSTPSLSKSTFSSDKEGLGIKIISLVSSSTVSGEKYRTAWNEQSMAYEYKYRNTNIQIHKKNFHLESMR